MDATNSDEYFVTALQIFDYCGAESSGTLRVDALMDKFAPFVKTNNEFSYLRSQLDPDHENPEINVVKLAKALNKYSESQKCKVDLDESFNLKTGQTPQDSDSGISTDGFQLLEELQCEVREKTHLASQLRSQLEFTDRQHEEALAAVAAERDALQAHLNVVREENVALSHVRRDFEEVSERFSACEVALAAARRDIDSYKKQNKVLDEQVAELENEKLTLQELLSKSKDECHRINEMYASRQCALREQNDALRTERADLCARLQDHDEFMQQLLKEKVLLEMELKDLLNKSNQTHLRMDRSIDISYTEDQMLTALDSLNADSRFSQDNRLLDEESFLNALREDQGRATNMSLFDEIRLSFSTMSRHNNTEADAFDNFRESSNVSVIAMGTQTDDEITESPSDSGNKDQYRSATKFVTNETQTDVNSEACKVQGISVSIQTDLYKKVIKIVTSVAIQTDKTIKMGVVSTGSQTYESKNTISSHTQTDEQNNNNIDCMECSKCLECDKKSKNIVRLENTLRRQKGTLGFMKKELNKYEGNLTMLQKFVDDGQNENNLLKVLVDNLQAKLTILEAVTQDQRLKIDILACDTCCAQSQTDFDTASMGTQVEMACAECNKRNAVTPHRSLRKYLWEPLKCLFQVFAVVCFLCAISLLYGVSRRWQASCGREAVPWRWLDAQDLMDLLLRIEYVADVPM